MSSRHIPVFPKILAASKCYKCKWVRVTFPYNMNRQWELWFRNFQSVFLSSRQTLEADTQSSCEYTAKSSKCMLHICLLLHVCKHTQTKQRTVRKAQAHTDTYTCTVCCKRGLQTPHKPPAQVHGPKLQVRKEREYLQINIIRSLKMNFEHLKSRRSLNLPAEVVSTSEF